MLIKTKNIQINFFIEVLLNGTLEINHQDKNSQGDQRYNHQAANKFGW